MGHFCPLSQGSVPRCSWKCQLLLFLGQGTLFLPNSHVGLEPGLTAAGFGKGIFVKGPSGIYRAVGPPSTPLKATCSQSTAGCPASVGPSVCGAGAASRAGAEVEMARGSARTWGPGPERTGLTSRPPPLEQDLTHTLNTRKISVPPAAAIAGGQAPRGGRFLCLLCGWAARGLALQVHKG